MNNLEQIEALLFVAGDEGISVAELAHATGFMRPAIYQMLANLTDKYAADETSALCVLETDSVYRLATKRDLAPLIKRYFETPLATNLSQASLEVLAITAYRQPVTRIDIDEIRGVSSAATLQKLVLRNLVAAHGRKDEPGRPILYETTPTFLNYFGLTSLTELPPLPQTEDLTDVQPDTSDLFLAAFTNQLAGTDDSEQPSQEKQEE